MLENVSTQVFSNLLVTILDDYSRLCNVDVSLDRQTILTRGASEGMFFFTRTLLAYGRDFLHAIDEGRCSSVMFSQFSRVNRSGGYPKFLSGFLERLFDRHGVVLPKDQIDMTAICCFKAIYQITCSFYKYEMDCKSSVVAEQYKNFVLVDRSLEAFDLRIGLGNTQFETARKLLLRVLSGFKHESKPLHGSGATAEGRSDVLDKWYFTYFHLRHDDALFPPEIYSHLWDESEDAYREADTGDQRGIEAELRVNFPESYLPQPIDVLTDVHKDSRGRRLICKQTVKNMMYQQSLSRQLVKHIESHPLTSSYVNFTDQTINQRMALDGSIDGENATVDLKEASDRNPWSGVRLLLPVSIVRESEKCRSEFFTMPFAQIERTGLKPDMFIEAPEFLREDKSYRKFLYADRFVPVFRYRKFAAMGSTMCFPIMALTIWAISVATIYHEVGDFDYAVKSVHIYGDDLIVPARLVSKIYAQLEAYGYAINKGKSFVNADPLLPKFRESCGVDAFNGVNVTPVKFRAACPMTFSDIGSICGWVEYANEFHKRGLKETAWLIREYVVKAVGSESLLLSGSDSAVSFTFGNTLSLEDHIKIRRWNRDLQRFEVKALCSRPRRSATIVDEIEERVSLFRWCYDGWLKRLHDDETYSPLFIDDFKLSRWTLKREEACMSEDYIDWEIVYRSGSVPHFIKRFVKPRDNVSHVKWVPTPQVVQDAAFG